jgi:predicted nucleic acid-binding Zn ribbon protein
MPTYVYRFLDCDGTIEVFQSFKDDALTEAMNPADGKVHPVKKVFTPVGVTFKGGGFYKNDSRGSSSSSSASNGTATTPSATPSTSGSNGDSSSSSSTSSTPATPAASSATKSSSD